MMYCLFSDLVFLFVVVLVLVLIHPYLTVHLHAIRLPFLSCSLLFQIPIMQLYTYFE